MTTFQTIVSLPDAGKQIREHEDLHELKLYLLACVRMGANIPDIIVHAQGRDLSIPIRAEIERQFNKGGPP